MPSPQQPRPPPPPSQLWGGVLSGRMSWEVPDESRACLLSVLIELTINCVFVVVSLRLVTCVGSVALGDLIFKRDIKYSRKIASLLGYIL